jgi:DNA mismatch repair ATPase MutS
MDHVEYLSQRPDLMMDLKTLLKRVRDVPR